MDSSKVKIKRKARSASSGTNVKAPIKKADSLIQTNSRILENFSNVNSPSPGKKDKLNKSNNGSNNIESHKERLSPLDREHSTRQRSTTSPRPPKVKLGNKSSPTTPRSTHGIMTNAEPSHSKTLSSPNALTDRSTERKRLKLAEFKNKQSFSENSIAKLQIKRVARRKKSDPTTQTSPLISPMQSPTQHRLSPTKKVRPDREEISESVVGSHLDLSSESDTVIKSEDIENKMYSKDVLQLQRKVTGSFIYSNSVSPIIFDSGKKFFHEDLSAEYFEPVKIEYKDMYAEYFYSNVHLNYIGVHVEKEEECCVVSVLKRAREGKYTCLKLDKKGSVLFYIKTIDFVEGEKKQTLEESIENHLSIIFPSMFFYIVHNPNFIMDLKQLEAKHPKQQTAFKLAILYSNGEEKTLQDFFNHRKASKRFFQFLNLLGEKINLKGWKKYRGDIGNENEQDTYYTEWQGIEVMFHVSVWMNAEQHRRLIGNDVVFVIYHDCDFPFDPGPLDSLGTVPQVFGVVKHFNDNYRLQFFSRPNIKPYNPPVPAYYCFAPEELKDFLLTKAYNGYCQALMCPPMNRLYEYPRSNSLLELSIKYPRTTKKEENKRRNSAKKRARMIINKNLRDPLILLVTVICALPPKSRHLSNSFVSITLEDTEQKTKVWREKKDPKKHPVWNEILAFPDLIAVDPALSSVKVELRESLKIGGFERIGQVEISFFEICKILNKEHWIELDSEISNKDEISGILCLKFEMKGPPALLALCPQCHLYLGGLDLIQYKTHIFHYKCFICSQCKVHIGGLSYVGIGDKLYCNKCNKEKLSKSSKKLQAVPIYGVNRIGAESPHTWIDNTFRIAFSWCGFCGDYFGFGYHGYICMECKYPSHRECVTLVPENCCHSPKDQEYHAKSPHEIVKKVVAITPKSKSASKSNVKEPLSARTYSKPKALFRRKSEHSTGGFLRNNKETPITPESSEVHTPTKEDGIEALKIKKSFLSDNNMKLKRNKLSDSD